MDNVATGAQFNDKNGVIIVKTNKHQASGMRMMATGARLIHNFF